MNNRTFIAKFAIGTFLVTALFVIGVVHYQQIDEMHRLAVASYSAQVNAYATQVQIMKSLLSIERAQPVGSTP